MNLSMIIFLLTFFTYYAKNMKKSSASYVTMVKRVMNQAGIIKFMTAGCSSCNPYHPRKLQLIIMISDFLSTLIFNLKV